MANVKTSHYRLARRWRKQCGQHFYGRRLTGAIWTQQSKNFTLINGKRQAVDSQELAEAPG